MTYTKWGYENVNEFIANSGCFLLTTKEIFISEKMNSKSVLDIQCFCGEKIQKIFKNFRVIPRCSKHGTEIQRITCMEKYGCECPLQNKEIREKTKATCFEKYGVEHHLQNKEVKEKSKATCLKKYGYENPNQNKEVREKVKTTCLEKYGCENPNQNKEVKEKSKATCLKKYGVEHHLQNKEVREKSKATCFEKYGCENPLQNKEVKEKFKTTCLQKYGVEYPNQNPEIHRKSTKSSFKSKEYELPSGKVVSLQGYEPFYMDILLESYDEKDILSDRIDMPELWYKLLGKKHRYFPDFYIPKEKLVVEIKSTWTLEVNIVKNVEKFKAVRDAGYNLRVIVFDSKKTLTDESSRF